MRLRLKNEFLNFIGLYTFEDMVKRENELIKGLKEQNHALRLEITTFNNRLYNNPSSLIMGIKLTLKDIKEIERILEINKFNIPNFKAN